jgi:glutathione S-transferase
MGKVPALRDGDLLLWESNAICQYLADRAGDASFFPADSKARADIGRWLFWEAGTWSPVIDVFTHENVRKPCWVSARPIRLRLPRPGNASGPWASC